MEPDPHTPTDHLETLEGLTLHPEFVRIEYAKTSSYK